RSCKKHKDGAPTVSGGRREDQGGEAGATAGEKPTSGAKARGERNAEWHDRGCALPGCDVRRSIAQTPRFARRGGRRRPPLHIHNRLKPGVFITPESQRQTAAPSKGGDYPVGLCKARGLGVDP